jgi:hypothetical protein
MRGEEEHTRTLTRTHAHTIASLSPACVYVVYLWIDAQPTQGPSVAYHTHSFLYLV